MKNEAQPSVHVVLQGKGRCWEKLHLSNPGPIFSNEIGSGALSGHRSGQCDIRAIPGLGC